MTIEEDIHATLQKLQEVTTEVSKIRGRDLRAQRIGNYSRVLEHLSNARTVLRLLAVKGEENGPTGGVKSLI